MKSFVINVYLRFPITRGGNTDALIDRRITLVPTFPCLVSILAVIRWTKIVSPAIHRPAINMIGHRETDGSLVETTFPCFPPTTNRVRVPRAIKASSYRRPLILLKQPFIAGRNKHRPNEGCFVKPMISTLTFDGIRHRFIKMERSFQ